MTVVIGLETKKGVIIGSDSSAVAGYEIKETAIPKAFKCGNILIASTGSFRAAQLLEHVLIPPKHEKGQGDLDYLVTCLVPEMREVFNKGGFEGESKSDGETGTSCVLGYNGKVYILYADFQVNRYACGFASIGSGSEYALGSLFSTKGLPPKKRVKLALKAACKFSTACCKPYLVLSMPGE